MTPLLHNSMTPLLHDSKTPRLKNSMTPWLHDSMTGWLQDSMTQWLDDSMTRWLRDSVTPFLQDPMPPLLSRLWRQSAKPGRSLSVTARLGELCRINSFTYLQLQKKVQDFETPGGKKCKLYVTGSLKIEQKCSSFFVCFSKQSQFGGISDFLRFISLNFLKIKKILTRVSENLVRQVMLWSRDPC